MFGNIGSMPVFDAYSYFKASQSMFRSSSAFLRQFFPSIKSHELQNDNSMVWSSALTSRSVIVEGDDATQDERTLQEPGVVFMGCKLVGAVDRSWRIKVNVLRGKLSLGFGEITSNASIHTFFCVDSRGAYHTNKANQQPWDSFVIVEGDTLRFRTSNNSGSLRVSYSK
jgi:hypothetical protein